MKKKKTPKTYRLSELTLCKLSWLANNLHQTETSIVETAIAQLYIAEHYGLELTKKKGE